MARAMKKNNQISSATAEKTYAIVCEEYEIPARKHTQYWTYLQDLEKLGVIRITLTNDANGRTAMIALPDIPSKVLAQKMESILDKGEEDVEL